MNHRHVGGTCVVALLAAGLVVGPACSNTTIIEENNPPIDAGGKTVEGGGSTPVGNDADSLDATIGMPGMASDGATTMDATVAPESGSDGATTMDATVALPDSTAPDTDAGAGDSGFTIVPSDAGNCPDAGPASISGTVYDPAGKNPIPHVFVFVPTSLPSVSPGTSSCETCDLPIGSYVAATMTDATGRFTLTGVPTGTVPVVFQIGKWRRQITLTTKTCQDTAIQAGYARLPRNRQEGDMPQIALLTGGLDDIGCFLTRMGIDAAEYGAPQSGGRVGVYQGLSPGGLGGPKLTNGTAGNCTNTSCPLWASKGSLEKYDLVLLGCEGDPYDATVDAGSSSLGSGAANITAAAKQAMHDWLDEGGKVLAVHFHYTWFMNGPPDFQGVASWKGYSLGNGTSTAVIETSFPKGQDFKNALLDAGALSSGNLNLNGVGDSVGAVNAPTVAWLEDQTSQDTKYLTFTTPVGGTCGKAALSDIHAGSAPSGDIPGSCKATDLSAQEKALELLFFDLSACVSDDSKAPPGPPPSN